MRKIFMAVALMLLATTQASANLIQVIDFTGNNQGVEDEFRFTQAGVELTVSAWTTNVDSSQAELMPWTALNGYDDSQKLGVYKGSTGFGVVSNSVDGYDLDGGSSSNLLDLDEGLLFSFSEQVNFLGFAAGELRSNDDLNLAIVNYDGMGKMTLTDVFIDVASSEEEDIFAVFPGILGQHFMVWVDGNDDDVRILDTAFIKVSEPTTLLIFLMTITWLVRTRVN